MNYSKIAVRAANVAVSQKISPVKAWELELKLAQKSDKGCPKGTFLGLCQNGFIKGIPVGSYTNSKKNANYGLVGRELLLAQPNRYLTDAKTLWQDILQVLELSPKASNQQAEVLIELWKSGLLL